MTRRRGELPPEEERLLGIERPSEEDEAAAVQRAAEEREVRRQYLFGLIQQPLFREWLMSHLVEFGTFANIHAAGPAGVPDPMATQFYAGQKAAGWTLWAEFDDIAPEWASLMRRETMGVGR